MLTGATIFFNSKWMMVEQLEGVLKEEREQSAGDSSKYFLKSDVVCMYYRNLMFN